VEDAIVKSRERGIAAEHFEEKAAEAPPVLGEIVAGLASPEHLWGHEISRSALAKSSATVKHSIFCVAKVGQFQVAILANQNVFGLDVSMYDALLVQGLQSKHYICRVELRIVFIHATLQVVAQRIKVTARAVLERQEQMRLRLKRKMHKIEQLPFLAPKF